MKKKSVLPDTLENAAKYLYAIQASEIASSLVYRCDRDAEVDKKIWSRQAALF